MIIIFLLTKEREKWEIVSMKKNLDLLFINAKNKMERTALTAKECCDLAFITEPYNKILKKDFEQYINDEVQLELVYDELVKLIKESKRDIINAFLCIELGLDPSKMDLKQQVCLETTCDYIEHMAEFRLLKNEYLNYYSRCMNDKKLHACLNKEK